MKIAVAMSGGVDSTASAYLLQKQGHDITGVSVKMFDSTDNNPVRKAEKACKELGIPFIAFDFCEIFKERIIDPFCKEYLLGRTPSPCIICNRKIKFGALLDAILNRGFDALATGHYAKIKNDGSRWFLSKGKDSKKDQSYFLFGLSQEMLSHILFPLSELTKDQTREITHQAGLHASKSKESQEICFIPDDDYKSFVESIETDIPPGNIIDINGNILGKHKGIHRYTIGQRRGLGISYSEPLYVIDIIPERNEIIAGVKENLLKDGLFAHSANYQKAAAFDGETVFAKIRSTHKPVQAQAFSQDNNRFELKFKEKTQQISPGQAAVLYNADGDLLAGGWIESSY